MWINFGEHGEVAPDNPALSGSGAVAGLRGERCWSQVPVAAAAVVVITSRRRSRGRAHRHSASQRLRGLRQLQSRQHAAFLEQGFDARALRDLLPRLDRWACAADPWQRGSPPSAQERLDQADPEATTGLWHQVHGYVCLYQWVYSIFITTPLIYSGKTSSGINKSVGDAI